MCVACPDPVLALKSPVEHKTVWLVGNVANCLVRHNSRLIEGVFLLVGSMGACTFMI